MTRQEAFDEILTRLGDVERSDDSAIGTCPLCTGSLRVKVGKVHPVAYCRGDGCGWREVFAALGVLELVDALEHPKAQLREHLRGLADGGLSEPDRLLFAALWSFTDDDGECWPSDRELAPLVGRSARSIRLMRKRLEAADVLDTTPHGRGRSNLYRLRQRAPRARGVDRTLTAAEPGYRARMARGEPADSARTEPSKGRDTARPQPGKRAPMSARLRTEGRTGGRTDEGPAPSAEDTGVADPVKEIQKIRAAAGLVKR